MKRCSSCKEVKPLTEFSTRSSTDLRIKSHCKVCFNERQRARQKAPEYRARHRQYMRTRDTEKNRARFRRHAKRYKERYPHKLEARRILRLALKAGKVIKPDVCTECGQVPPNNRLGRTQLQAHHADYSKPLEVKWVCPMCHSKQHRRSAPIEGEKE